MINTKSRRLSRSIAARARVFAGASLLSLVIATPARAGPDGPAATTLPSGGEVVAGRATIAANGSAMTVTQSSNRGIINWQSFDIGTDASVRFVQPDANSVTLNRVLSGAGSTIAGKLSANGKVYVVNPSGILFTATAQVDVGGLVAAAGSIADSDFMAGRDRFTVAATGAVTNRGSIVARSGGQVVLIGGSVSNLGAIRAAGGDAVLASGARVTLEAGAEGHLKIEVDPATSRALVENGGLIAAHGGQVLMTAQGASAALSSVVSNTGTIEAQTLANRSGRILLLAGMDGGLVHAGGTLDASAPGGGDGGFIETSAAGLSFAPDLHVSTLAATGRTGKWLIDPYNLTISSSASTSVSLDSAPNPWVLAPLGSGANINSNTLSSYLASSNISLNTVGAGSEAGNITVNAPISWNAATTLTLLADANTGGIFLNAAINGSNPNSAVVLSAGAGGINQGASGGITAGRLTLSTANGGSVLLNQATNQVARLAASSAQGSFSFGSASALTVEGAVTSGVGAVTLIAAGNLTINAPLTDGNSNAAFNLRSSGGTLNIARDITLSGGGSTLSLNAANGYVLVNGARVSMTGASAGLTINGQAYTPVRSVNELQAVGSTGFYALLADIDASATASWNGGAGFAPLSLNSNSTFAGMGHIIDGLTINRPSSSSFVGLFGFVGGSSVVRDFTLLNASVNGNQQVGMVTGVLERSTLSNVHVTGQVNGSLFVGGVVGNLYEGTITLASSTAAVAARDSVAGGLVGVATDNSVVTDSYVTGTVTAPTGAAGLIGRGQQPYLLTLNRVYASGRITGGANSGGLVGFFLWSGAATSATNAYWDVNSTGMSGSAAGTGIANGAAYNQSTYGGFDFTSTWVMFEGETRPMLRNEASSVIVTPHAMQLVALAPDRTYSLGANLDLAAGGGAYGYGDVWGSQGFVPIGTGASPFTGNLLGNGRHISGLMIDRAATSQVGLFGAVSGGSTSDVTLIGGSVRGYSDVGALIGNLANGSVSGVGASVDVTSVSTNDSNAGGLVGASHNANITAAWATGNVSGGGVKLGGLVGDMWSGAITRSYATGNVTGTNPNMGYSGGLVGANGNSGNGGSISQSYATGNVSGAGAIGGLVGLSDGAIADAYAMGMVTGTGSMQGAGGLVGVNSSNGTITGAYSTGRVTGGSQTGGAVGYNSGVAGAITSTYWDVATSGQSAGIGGGQTVGATGRLTTQLQGSLPAGFLSPIWGAGTNLYPYFNWRYAVTPGAVSGTVTAGAGGSALAGVKVTGVSGGTAIGSATTGANGYYYILTDASALSSPGALTYLDDGPRRGAAVGDSLGVNGIRNLDIYADAVHLRTSEATLSATRAQYLAIRGGYDDGDLAFLPAVGTGPLTGSGYGVYLDAAGNYTIDATFLSGGALTFASSGTFGISSSITLAANGGLAINAPLAWGDSSELTLSTTGGGALTLGGTINATNGSLVIIGSGDISAPNALAVKTFALNGGNWRQLGALPGFSVVDFRLDPNASFLRALGGDGSAATPYRIADVYGLQGIGSSSLLAQAFALDNDIDAGATTGWNGLTGFVPIGSDSNRFTGSLDGRGHAVTGLWIHRNAPFAGLFGASSGAIRDLTLTGQVTAGGVVGGLIGAMSGGSVTGVFANVAVTGASSGQAGGLVGLQNGGTIVRSSASGNVSGAGDAVGGLVGQQGAATIDQSFATGAVSTTFNAAGGLVGRSGGTISNAYASGSVTAQQQTGGLVGDLGGTILNSYATGSVSGSAVKGGLVGNNAGTITASFWDTERSGQAAGIGSGAAGGVSGLAGNALRRLASFAAAGWDIDDAGGTGRIWRIYDGNTTPLLRAFLTPLTATGGNVSRTYSGSRTSAAGQVTYSIATPDNGRLFGTPGYVAASADAGTYTGAALSLVGLYSNQGGYDVIAVPGSFTIVPADLTVDLNAAAKVYDGRAWSGGNGVTYSGFVNGEDASVLGGALVFGGDAQGATNVGMYSLSASGLISNNYTFHYNPASLSITRAPLQVTVNGATKTYDGLGWSGGAGVSYSGLVNGETASALGGSLVYGGAAQGAVTPGSYSLTASGLTSGNYTISYVSGSLVVNPAPLTVTVNGATKTYDGLAWSGGNGVSYAGLVNGETASVLGGSLVYGGSAQGAVNAGSYTLTASGLTSGNYAITYVGNTLVVNPAALTVTVNGATKTYDGFAWSGGNGVSYSGLVHGETTSVLGGSLVYGGSAQGAVNAGSYTLTASGLTSGNYAITYVGNTLVVNPAALTVTVNGATKTYDGLAWSGGNGVSYAGLVHGETPSVLGGSLAYGGSAQGAVNAGSYTLTASGLTSGNYAITYVGNTLVVNPAALTVTVNGATKTYDGLAWSGGNGVSYSGLVNGETASVLGGSLVYGGSAQGAVNAGSYTLTASGLTSGNYAITYVGNTLVVNPAALTVTVNGATKTYDGLAWSGGNGVSYAGLVNGETASVLGGSLIYGGSAQGAVNAGSYSLAASGLTSSNYAIRYVAGALVVNPAALTVTANSLSIPLLGSYGPLTYSVAGLANSDAVASVLSGSLATNADVRLPGSYAIGQGTLAVVSDNYRLVRFVGGTLTVERPVGAPDGGFMRQPLFASIMADRDALAVPMVAIVPQGAGGSPAGHLSFEPRFIR